MSLEIPAQSEDPLPSDRQDAFSYETPLPDSGLGELVEMDPADPFVWLQTLGLSKYQRPTQQAKEIMWLLYRMNGSFPMRGKPWDETPYNDAIFQRLTQTDRDIIDAYVYHLPTTGQPGQQESLARAQAAEKTGQPVSMQLSPEAHSMFMAILEHQRILSAQELNKNNSTEV